MSRRSAQMFNLSFLDLLSGALGAVIFLFIITPKGGAPSAKGHQVVASIDTIHQQLFGDLPDSLLSKNAGDTLLVLIGNFQEMPSTTDCPPIPAPLPCPTCPSCPAVVTPVSPPPAKATEPMARKEENKNLQKSINTNPRSKPVPVSSNPIVEKGYKGDPPSVPCKVSFEISWEDISDNVDLFVCKEGNCIYGARRRNTKIGFWDSGKSRTSIIGGDVRTTLEAVRQFDQPIPGTYRLYAQFKNSEKKRSTVTIQGLIYTRGDQNQEQGERFYKTLALDKKKRTSLGTVVLQANGSFKFSN